jgi:hypothetical protein
MGEVIRFIPKSELERARLVREARAIYDSIFPPADAVSEQGADKLPLYQGRFWNTAGARPDPSVLKPPSVSAFAKRLVTT